MTNVRVFAVGADPNVNVVVFVVGVVDVREDLFTVDVTNTASVVAVVPRLCVTAMLVALECVAVEYFRATTAVSIPTVSVPTLMPVPAPTSSVEPVRVRPFPAVGRVPPPTCAHTMLLEPIVGESVVCVYALSAFVVPDW
jgi:hypothetical protein